MQVRQKVQEILGSRGWSITDLARLAGPSRTTIHNLLSGRSKSRTARQSITNVLEIELWEGIVPERTYVFEKGIELDFPGSEAIAAEIERELGDAVRRRGTTIKFLRKKAVCFSPVKMPAVRKNRTAL